MPRKIDEKGQIKIYNEEIAIIHRHLKKMNEGLFDTQ